MKTFVKAFLALAGLAALALPEVAWACEKCFGAGADTQTAESITASMLALIALTGVVWGGIGMFFVNMRKRARMLEPGDLVVTETGDILALPHDIP